MITRKNEPNNRGSRFLEKALPSDPTATRVISLTGDVRDGGRVHEFHRECQRSIHPGRRRVVLNLAGVADADTKLVASLVAALRRAWSSRVVCDIRVSPRLRDWIALCRVERLLNGGTGASGAPSCAS